MIAAHEHGGHLFAPVQELAHNPLAALRGGIPEGHEAGIAGDAGLFQGGPVAPQAAAADHPGAAYFPAGQPGRPDAD